MDFAIPECLLDVKSCGWWLKLGQKLFLVQGFLSMLHRGKPRRGSETGVSNVFPELVGHLNSPLVVQYNLTTEVLGAFLVAP